jgi:hypothetical protein
MTGFEFWGSAPLRLLLDFVGEGFKRGAEPVRFCHHHSVAQPGMPRFAQSNRCAGWPVRDGDNLRIRAVGQKLLSCLTNFLGYRRGCEQDSQQENDCAHQNLLAVAS